VRARLELADRVRPDAAEMVSALKGAGLRMGILSGDREAAVRPVARAVGVTEVWSGLAPTDKVAALSKARRDGEVVGMVGDGLNDAPALAAADVGIALAGGTDLTREAGDVVLLGNELRRLPWLIALARDTRRVIGQNLAWAFGYNAIMLALAFFGRLHPLAAAVLMLISSFFVLGNSLRLRKAAPAEGAPPPARELT
ncbi:MAG: HAD-IC family P-type ATPase, partial [Armatimonadetes bacterium]|nr:HAD-IC family P-type ATPase [Armatimonadota bacterium]